MKQFFASLFRREPPVLPILRNWQADDVFAETIVHRRINDDYAVFLAHVGPTPHGTIGMDYVLNRNVADADRAAMFEKAFANLQKGLRGKAMSEGSGPPEIFVLERKGGFAASAIALPDFYENMSQRVNAREIVAVAPAADFVVVAAAGTPAADKASASVKNSETVRGLNFTPAAFVLDGSIIRTLRTSET